MIWDRSIEKRLNASYEKVGRLYDNLPTFSYEIYFCFLRSVYFRSYLEKVRKVDNKSTFDPQKLEFSYEPH